MKLMSHSIIKKIIPIITLAIVSLVVWYTGPSLVIAHHAILMQPEKRFSVIVILILGWVLLKLTFAEPAKHETSTTTLPVAIPDSVKKLESLHGKFQGAVEFLKKTIISK